MTRIITIAVALTLACGGPAAPDTTPKPDPSTTGTVTGTVRDRATGHSLSFATVVASPAGTGERPPDNTATTDGNGAFAVHGLAPGAYDILVYYADNDVRWQRVDIAAGDERAFDIEINAAGGEAQEMGVAMSSSPTRRRTAAAGVRGILAGTVVDQASGEPLEGATIAASVGAMHDAQMAVADASGKFQILGLRPGVYRLSVYYRLVDYGDIEVSINNVEVTGGQTTSVPIRLDTSVRAAD